MRKGNFIFKLIVGVIFLSFILPIKPPVSHAQAKLCCKKFCAHHIKNTPEKKCRGSHENTSDRRSMECCQSSCPHGLFRDGTQNPTLSSLKRDVNSSHLNPVQAIVVFRNNWIPKKLNSWNDQKTLSKNTRFPLLFILNSSFLI